MKDEMNRDGMDEAASENITYDIVGVRFKTTGKIYYFAPGDMSFSEGDHAIVETSRGIEYGTVAVGNKTVTEKEVVLPLRPVLRRATQEDDRVYEENKRKEKEAAKICGVATTG